MIIYNSACYQIAEMYGDILFFTQPLSRSPVTTPQPTPVASPVYSPVRRVSPPATPDLTPQTSQAEPQPVHKMAIYMGDSTDEDLTSAIDQPAGLFH